MLGVLERLLVTLEVRLEAFALLDVAAGQRLVFDAADAVLVHHVLEGDGWIDTAAAPPLRFEAGSVVILPAGRAQALRASDAPASDVAALAHCAMVKDGMIRFDATGGAARDLRIVSGAMVASRRGSHGLFGRLRAPLVERFENMPAIPPAFALLREEVAAPGLGTRALVGSVLRFCMVQLLRRHLGPLADVSPIAESLGNRKLARAIAAVLEAPADAHSVAALAGAAGMSRSAFARAFRDSFGFGPMEFVAKTRLQHGAEMLRGTDLPVKAIAEAIGFASRSHFSRAFRAAYGQDPRSFRRAARVPLDAPGAIGG